MLGFWVPGAINALQGQGGGQRGAENMPWPVGYVCRYFLEKTKGRNKKTFLKEICLNRGVGDIFGKNM